MTPNALETAKMGLGRAEKGPFSSFQGPIKIGRALKGFLKGSRRVGKASRRVWKALEGLQGHFGVILAGFRPFWAGHLGHLGHVRVSRNRLDLVTFLVHFHFALWERFWPFFRYFWDSLGFFGGPPRIISPLWGNFGHF